MKTSETIEALAKAMAAAQGEMQNANKSAVNPHFNKKYADFAAIRDASAPILAKHGLTITQFTSLHDGALSLVTRLLHESGQWIEGDYPLPNVPDKPQVMGSAITYARRYCWAAVCGIAGEEDDDGNAAQQHGSGTTQHQKQNGNSAVQPQAHPDDLGATDYKAGLRAFEVERIGVLQALRGGEMTAEEANDRYREIRSGTLLIKPNGKEKLIKTEALLKQCMRSPEWHDNERDGWQGFEHRLKDTRDELDRALAKAGQAMPDDPFADLQEASE